MKRGVGGEFQEAVLRLESRKCVAFFALFWYTVARFYFGVFCIHLSVITSNIVGARPANQISSETRINPLPPPRKVRTGSKHLQFSVVMPRLRSLCVWACTFEE